MMNTQKVCSDDGGLLLWSLLLSELQNNESDFKHRIAVLDHYVKGLLPVRPAMDIAALSKKDARDWMPFRLIEDSYPWHGCKFASTAVLYLLTQANKSAKRVAAKPTSRSLGGCKEPTIQEITDPMRQYALREAFTKAKLLAMTEGICTGLHILVMDVEVMKNPAESNRQQVLQARPATFAHSCVMTVSPAGVYLFQAYGRRGYTLLQHMETHNEVYPLSLEDGEAWVHRFEEISTECSGKWTTQVNAAYAFCFGVDLVKFGNVSTGSQLDADFAVYEFQFDASTVQRNFALLPRADKTGKIVACRDGANALSDKLLPGEVRPNGGAKHSFIPGMRCGGCGVIKEGFKRCASCKSVTYCCKRCQASDWKMRHKQVCEALASYARK
jgi:hypothetical protein